MLNSNLNKVGVVILAAGEGKRMKSTVPKVMNLLRGEPLVAHVVKSVENAGFAVKPVIIVNPNHNLVQEYLGDRALYVVQKEQLGTAHAVGCADRVLKGKTDCVIVLYGDMPFIKPASLQHLVDTYNREKSAITLMTVTVPDFNDWKAQFADFGRIKRDEDGNILDIVEKKDASPEELAITEVNTSYFCFDANWLWQNLKEVKNQNNQKEFYLVDLVKIARAQGAKIGTVQIDPKEGIGINTKEHLDIAHNI
jgi:bifunctional UDP-N-acetylglucosamine pyrophosphorylase/glucosamine-1-phosphate N-acetyltransferase